MSSSHAAPTAATPEQWTEVIQPQTSLLDLRLGEVWRYRDLLRMFVQRDFVAQYKQTILGPVWFFIQPVLTAIMYYYIFGRVAKLGTDGLPPFAFYLAGITLWNYFSECLNKTATIFRDNAQIFGKVYFPRLVMPLSVVVSNLVRFGVQFLLFLLVVGYFLVVDPRVHLTAWALLTPVLLLMMAGIGLGLGLVFSSLTTKYRDLVFLLTFGVQLAMYATPVIMSLKKYQEASPLVASLIAINPLTPIFEVFRLGFLGQGTVNPMSLLYSAAFTLGIVALGTIIFNKVEKSFMDTV